MAVWAGKTNPGLRFQRVLLLGIVLKSHESMDGIVLAERSDFGKGFLPQPTINTTKRDAVKRHLVTFFGPSKKVT